MSIFDTLREKSLEAYIGKANSVVIRLKLGEHLQVETVEKTDTEGLYHVVTVQDVLHLVSVHDITSIHILPAINRKVKEHVDMKQDTYTHILDVLARTKWEYFRY